MPLWSVVVGPLCGGWGMGSRSSAPRIAHFLVGSPIFQKWSSSPWAHYHVGSVDPHWNIWLAFHDSWSEVGLWDVVISGSGPSITAVRCREPRCLTSQHLPGSLLPGVVFYLMVICILTLPLFPFNQTTHHTGM